MGQEHIAVVTVVFLQCKVSAYSPLNKHSRIRTGMAAAVDCSGLGVADEGTRAFCLAEVARLHTSELESGHVLLPQARSRRSRFTSWH